MQNSLEKNLILDPPETNKKPETIKEPDIQQLEDGKFLVNINGKERIFKVGSIEVLKKYLKIEEKNQTISPPETPEASPNIPQKPPESIKITEEPASPTLAESIATLQKNTPSIITSREEIQPSPEKKSSYPAFKQYLQEAKEWLGSGMSRELKLTIGALAFCGILNLGEHDTPGLFKHQEPIKLSTLKPDIKPDQIHQGKALDLEPSAPIEYVTKLSESHLQEYVYSSEIDSLDEIPNYWRFAAEQKGWKYEDIIFLCQELANEFTPGEPRHVFDMMKMIWSESSFDQGISLIQIIRDNARNLGLLNIYKSKNIYDQLKCAQIYMRSQIESKLFTPKDLDCFEAIKLAIFAPARVKEYNPDKIIYAASKTNKAANTNFLENKTHDADNDKIITAKELKSSLFTKLARDANTLYSKQIIKIKSDAKKIMEKQKEEILAEQATNIKRLERPFTSG